MRLQIPIQKLKQAARPTPAPAAKKAPAADAETAEAGIATASAPADSAAGAKGRAPRKKFKARHVAGVWHRAISYGCRKTQHPFLHGLMSSPRLS